MDPEEQARFDAIVAAAGIAIASDPGLIDEVKTKFKVHGDKAKNLTAQEKQDLHKKIKDKNP